MRLATTLSALLLTLAALPSAAETPVSGAPAPAAPTPTAPASQAERELYVVATSHLDTQWRWTIQETIDDFLPATLRDNFALFEKYPGYVFSFEGAFRYQLAREYYPAEYEKLKAYVRAGRWKVAGSWLDAVDTHVPSPESLIRQTLYGNGFFRRELGVTSRDVFLPDCFGFGFALPSVAAHCGLTAFSTQKLTWGSSIRIPFDLGLWEGVDGSRLIAEINPGDYASELKGNLTLDPEVYAVIDRQAAASGLPVAMRYFGTGDVGIAPLEPSVAWLQKSLEGPGPLTVRSVAPDQLARDLQARGDDAVARLPRYRGEFLLTSHGAGCYTSQAAMKRYNRGNQRLADAAERAAVAAAWLGGAAYPREELREAWTRFLWHQFHDDLTGTSIPEAYTFSWNDEAIAQNRFADLLGGAVGSVARALDTRPVDPARGGVPLVVFNPLSRVREDVVEATVRFPGAAPPAVRVSGPDRVEVPAQVVARSGDAVTVVFVARVDPVSFSVFEVSPTVSRTATPQAAAGLAVTPRGLENGIYRVALDGDGNVASVVDKRQARELLSGPATLQLIEDEPRKWAAWEVEYSALSAPPREVVGGPVAVRVIESGPARVALEVVRHAAGSTFTQTIRLAAGGAGDRVELLTDVNWRTKGTLLKAAFPLAAASPTATYDLGLGVVERGTNRPNLYEVPAQEWADLSDLSGPAGGFGVAVLNDSRHGWDKPDDHTLRLTLVHTPRVVPSWSWLAEQASNDLGHHRVLMALAGHAGGWRDGEVQSRADRLNQPLTAWQVAPHAGELGRSFSLLRLEGGGSAAPAVAVRALKLAEESDEVVVRLQELSGRVQRGVRLRFARPVVAWREVNGAEEPATVAGTGGALPDGPPPALSLHDGAIELDLLPFRPRTVALRLGEPPVRLEAPTTRPLALPFDRDGVSGDRERGGGDFDGEGRTLAGELLPATVVAAGVPFETGPRGAGEANVLVPRGQRLELPAGSYDRLYLLAAAVGGDRQATFAVDGVRASLLVPDWAEPVGQWNSRLVGGELQESPERIAPAYAKDLPVAWIGTHRHDPFGGNEAYVFTHLFRLRLDLPPGAHSVTLPDDPALRLLAATLADAGPGDAVAAQRFADPETGTVVHLSAATRGFLERLPVTLTSPTPGATIRYTLDGAEPTASSAVYTGPIALDRTATVKARAFAPGLDERFVAAATFTRLLPEKATDVPPAELAPGLACRLYEGEWRKLPAFAALQPVRTLTLPTVALPADRPKDRFGLVCEGFLAVNADAITTFSLRSEDGSELLVDGVSRIRHDTIDYMRRNAEVALAKGLHRIEVRYFQRDFVAGLELLADAPDEPLAPVPAARLFHRPPAP